MVPNGWEKGVIEDIAKVSSGGTPSRQNDSFWLDGQIPWVTTTEVQFGIINETEQKITEEGLKNSSAKLFPKDTILMAMYGQGKTRGQVAKLGIEASTNQACAALLLNDGFEVDYYYQYLVSQYENIRELANSGGQQNLSAGIIKGIHVPIPPVAEQRKIAKILSTWDKAVSTTERLIDNSKQQKKALMQQLLTGKKRLLDDSGKPFEGEWEEVKLGDLSSKVTKGTTPSTNGFSFQQDGINFVKVESISSSGRFDRSKFAYIDNDCYESFKRSQLEKDDILFSIAGALGRTALVDETILPANTNQALAIVRLNRTRTVHRYIIYFLNSPRIASVIKGLTAKAAQPNLSLKDVNGLTILLPSLEEQEKISTALFNADKEIELLEQQLADLKQEKKALMQQLLTGKRRVKVDDEAVA
ncbi:MULTISPECIES: restriction endonuclease subunit S [unclassified Alteromonas]|uniref:restriction endonuclease subunit S n=1 Tax=unclassified Alteromonas TaxID=2614992 RepID=UPI000509FC9A|nr:MULTISPECIES: restriction endonuclease subunit S [unclassified Alteromonas]